MEAKKLLADENKKQSVKRNKYVSWVLYVKFRIENIVWLNILLSWKTYAINI